MDTIIEQRAFKAEFDAGIFRILERLTERVGEHVNCGILRDREIYKGPPRTISPGREARIVGNFIRGYFERIEAARRELTLGAVIGAQA